MASGFGYVDRNSHFLRLFTVTTNTYVVFIFFFARNMLRHPTTIRIHTLTLRHIISAKGGVGRCYPFWLDFSECVVRSFTYSSSRA